MWKRAKKVIVDTSLSNSIDSLEHYRSMFCVTIFYYVFLRHMYAFIVKDASISKLTCKTHIFYCTVRLATKLSADIFLGI